MRYQTLIACAGIGMMVAAAPTTAEAQFVPPAGYSGQGARSTVAPTSDANAPPLARIPDAAVSSLIVVNPAYRRGTATAHAKVVGAFSIAETSQRHVIAAWSAGFLPVTLLFSDGECYSLDADYVGGTLSNGQLNKVPCGQRPEVDERRLPSPPPAHALELVGTAWGYAGWLDKDAGTTVITAPGAKTFQPLFTARLISSAVMAMNGPDWPGGNVTLVGKVAGKLTVLTMEVGY